MTDTPDTTPPTDYPAEQWAETGDDYYVPAELREAYAAFTPSERDQRGYAKPANDMLIDGQLIDHPGTVISVPTTIEIPHAHGGHGDHDALITTEKIEANRLRRLAGHEDYWRWLHIQRLDHAKTARRRAELHRHLDAVHGQCQVCGEQGPSVIAGGVWLPSVAVHAYSERYQVSVCPDCAPVLAEAVRSAHADLAAGRELPDGQTVGQVCAELASHIVAQANQPAEAGR
jgi:hypothetical protein